MPTPSELRNELRYYHDNQIDSKTSATSLNFTQIQARPAQVATEYFNARPQDIFFFTLDGRKFIGRKLLSQLNIEGKITGTKCSQIKASMLLGLAEREQITDKAIILFYRPLLAAEKLAVFNLLKTNLQTEIYFPYPFLNAQKKEDVSPDEFWNTSNTQVSSLNYGEVEIRDYTVALLAKFNLKNKKIYDPACSTGKFLTHIKQSFPQVRTIGQDLNKEMVAYAKANSLIDEIHGGDAGKSPVPTASVDFIFFRFLNLEVVTTELANELFSTIANRCKDGGYLILLGHTPILLGSQWFEKLGLVTEQCIGYSHKEDSVFQYYVLKKVKPVPQLSYDRFLMLNHLQSNQNYSPKLFNPATIVSVLPDKKHTDAALPIRSKL